MRSDVKVFPAPHAMIIFPRVPDFARPFMTESRASFWCGRRSFGGEYPTLPSKRYCSHRIRLALNSDSPTRVTGRSCFLIAFSALTPSSRPVVSMRTRRLNSELPDALMNESISALATVPPSSRNLHWIAHQPSSFRNFATRSTPVSLAWKSSRCEAHSVQVSGGSKSCVQTESCARNTWHSLSNALPLSRSRL